MEITIENQDSQINLFPKNLIEEVTQNVQMILISPKYSVPLDRDFGTSHKQLDTPVNVAQPKLIMEIVDAIEKYEPRAEITKINFKVDEAKAGKLIPVVGVKIKDE
ncbi:GPW/gp25 family protein [Anaerococcus degeneri]|uniref:GPW/gp25 family protein n=1 Tax=Anaerococcus degeneri TaxID=361500 RepID=A0ABS7YYJ8_9FIRM|nr:GPW/gp25 family protein [Anaerococcus degeneri]MBP2015696.1 phage baseplate assembly protein W [Anaerococcus degeneri]MCA2096058.1 GPW/gp25 family protein [Anaerococcus degeneri]